MLIRQSKCDSGRRTYSGSGGEKWSLESKLEGKGMQWVTRVEATGGGVGGGHR